MANKKYQIQTYVDEATKKKIDLFCEKNQESISSVLRRAIIKYLEGEENDNKV